MDKTNITVTMPIAEYERLKAIEISFADQVRTLLKTIRKNEEPIMTEDLKQLIFDLQYDM